MPLRTPEAFQVNGVPLFVSVTAPSQAIRGTLGIAKGKAADSASPQTSIAARAETAYDAVHLCAVAALMAAGYRVRGDDEAFEDRAPVEVLEAACALADLGPDTFERLNAVRSVRNMARYAGQHCSEDDAAEAQALMRLVIPKLVQWVRRQRPDLHA